MPRQPCPAVPYLVDLPADLPNSPHQELLQMATLSAWPPVLSNQAPRKEEQIRYRTAVGRELEEFMGAVAKRKHGKEVGLDKGE